MDGSSRGGPIDATHGDEVAHEDPPLHLLEQSAHDAEDLEGALGGMVSNTGSSSSDRSCS